MIHLLSQSDLIVFSLTIYKFSHFTYNTDSRQFTSPEERTYLRKKVADVLCYFLENQTRVITKDELLDSVWEHGEYRESSLLQSVRTLRKLFGESAQHPKFIRTVHLKGYEWIYKDVTYEILANESATLPVEEANVPTEKTELVKPNDDTGISVTNYWRVIISSFVLLTLSVIGYGLWQLDTTDTDPPATNAKIIILPFINDTAEEDLQWLELGYADMFTRGIRKTTQQAVAPITEVQGALQQLVMSSRLYSKSDVTKLIDYMNADIAVSATISKDNDKLRFNYRIQQKGKLVKSASIVFPDLPSSLASLVRQVANELPYEATITDESQLISMNIEARADFAKGIQAIQTKGVNLARSYFEAALFHHPNHPAIKAKLAYCLFIQGNWIESQEIYQSLLSNNNKLTPYEHLSVINGYSWLLLEQNQQEHVNELITKANNISQLSQMPYLHAEQLRVQAQWHQLNGDNKKRHQRLSQANQIAKEHHTKLMQADALYYLGSPANIGLEVDPLIDVAKNKHKLTQALNYYQELGNEPQQGLTHLAIAQNYYFPTQMRVSAIKQAKTLFQSSGNNFHLIDTLIYQAYFLIQFHEGARAEKALIKAKMLLKNTNDVKRTRLIDFFSAFAILDQGIDRGTGTNKKALRQAITQFEQLISLTEPLQIGSQHADSILLLGWAHAELKQTDKANKLYERAINLYQTMGYENSKTLAIISLMDEQLKLAQWENVISLAEGNAVGYLGGKYLARAYYQTKQFDKAWQTLSSVELNFKEQWQQEDSARLIDYATSSDELIIQALGNEVSSHITYCDALWNTDDIISVNLELLD